MKRRPAWGKIAAVLIAAAALGAAWRYTPLADFLSAERIMHWAKAVRETPWSPLALALAYTVGAFIMFPRPLLTLLAVMAFGPWLGFTYSMAGILCAALATYYAGRLLPPGTLRRYAGDKLDDIAKVLRRYSFSAIFAASFVPTPPFAVQGAIAGALRIRLWRYSLGTLLGMAPGVLAGAVFGRQIAAALEDPSTISYGLLAAVVVVFVALSYFVRRWFARKSAALQ